MQPPMENPLQAGSNLPVVAGSTALSTLNFDISLRPDFALLAVKLSQGQKIYAEPSAMASMDSTVKLRAGRKGGLRRTLGRACGGESLIINTFPAESGAGEVTFVFASRELRFNNAVALKEYLERAL